LIYIFSVASFYLIEKSFYEKQILRNKKFTLFIFLSTLIIIFTGFLIASGKVNIKNSINKQVSDIQKKFPNLDIKDIAQKRDFQTIANPFLLASGREKTLAAERFLIFAAQKIKSKKSILKKKIHF
jgi:NADH:ubiquinone oxidoreductase subunit 6 (subunit J)